MLCFSSSYVISKIKHSLNCSMEKTVSSSGNKNTNYQSEESGWTYYFDDFSKDIEPSYCTSSLGGGSSMVSDAASCAAWKFSHQIHVRDSPNLSKKLFLKKTKHISQDDTLEDTASSPVNSPKDRGFKSEHYSKLETKNDCDLNFNGKNIECTDLKKRGLCLVPMSMLVNYYG